MQVFKHSLRLAGLAGALGLSYASPALADRQQYDGTFDEYHQIQGNLFEVIGWPATKSYCDMNPGGTYDESSDTCTGISNGPPQNGVLGTFGSIGTTLFKTLQASGVTACLQLPTSAAIGPTGAGTLSNLGDYTFTSNYAAPTHTIPAAFAGGGGTYSNRINVTASGTTGDLKGEALKVGVEFVCGSNEAFMEIQGPFGPSDVMTMFLWLDNTVSTKQMAEFAMIVRDAAGGETQAELMRFLGDGKGGFTLNDVSMGSQSGVSTASDFHGYRTGLNASGPTVVSAYAENTAGNGSNDLAAATSDDVADYTTHAATSAEFSATNAGGIYGGCVDFTTKIDPTASTLCTGFSLATPTAPAVDASGDFTFKELGSAAFQKALTLDF